MPQNFFFSILSNVSSKYSRNFWACPPLSGPQNHSFHEHERTQNELTVDCVTSYVPCLTTWSCWCLWRCTSFSGTTGKYRKLPDWFPLWSMWVLCLVFSGLGLLVQEAVALLMIILKCSLPGQCGPNSNKQTNKHLNSPAKTQTLLIISWRNFLFGWHSALPIYPITLRRINYSACFRFGCPVSATLMLFGLGWGSISF